MRPRPVLSGGRRYRLLDLETAPGHFDMRQTVALRIPRDFKDSRAKRFPILWCRRICRKRVEQCRHAVSMQGGTEKAWEQFSSFYQRRNLRIAHRRLSLLQPLQIPLQQCLIADRNVLIKCIRPLFLPARKGYAAPVQFLLYSQEQSVRICPRLIHLIDKEKYRHTVALQQPPQGQRVTLYPIRAVYDEHRTVQHLKCPLHLRRKIHMSRRI